MKTILLTISIALILSLIEQKQAFSPSIFDKEVRDNSKVHCIEGSAGIDQSWYANSMKIMADEEYNISFNTESGEYKSPNRKNNLRFIYHKNGFRAIARNAATETTGEWKIDFHVSDMKRQMSNTNDYTIISQEKYSQLTDLSKSQINVSGNRAFIENDNIRIEYTNDDKGMRQDFIVKHKPEGKGKLRLNLSADTKLKMITGADALMFKDENGIEQLKYSALKCWDADGRELRAYFEDNYRFQVTSLMLKEKNNNSKIKNQESIIETNSKSGIPIESNLKSKIQDTKLFSIVVDDEDAVYPITIDPLSTSPGWDSESNQTGAQFGFSAQTAGDVNGDGYSDVIVGAPYYDNGEADAGKTFLFFGSATGLSAVANWTTEGNESIMNVGNSVSTAGDVNGDGFSDVVVGTLNTNLSWKSRTSGTAENLQDVFLAASNGWAVGSNGEIITTADSGKSWSSQTSSTTNDLRSVWFTSNDTGWAVGLSGTIRFTSDGGVNWIPQTSANAQNLSCVYFRTSTEGYIVGEGGSIQKTTNAGINWSSQTSGVAQVLRDIVFTSSTDGWIVGTNGRILKTTNGGTNWTAQTSGTTQILRGVYFSSAVNGLAFGHAGTILKTTNGGTNWTAQISGTTQDLYACYFNSATEGWTAGFGSTVLKTTDGGASWASQNSGVSGDLRSIFFQNTTTGIAVGSSGLLYTYNSLSSGSDGIANVYNGSATGLPASPSSVLSGATGTGGLYNIVSAAGDVNGDGYSDVIVSYPDYSAGTGVVLIYNGSASGSQITPATTKTGSLAAALFGKSVSTAGDVDGDGYSDIIAGSPDFGNGQHFEGKAFIFRGSAAGLITNAYWDFESNLGGANLGLSVCTAGDVNGDGYSDIIIGSEGAFSFGKVYGFLGSSSGLAATPDWSYEDLSQMGNIVSSVSAAGDVNGDGYSDVVVGWSAFTNGETNEGKALVFQGSAAGLSASPDWSTESNQSSANFGNCVFTAGDINGDGYSDVMISANFYDNGETDEGKVFVYNGSPTGISDISNWTTAGGQANCSYGTSVASAGDVNGDGYADVIIGAPYFDNGQTDEGKVFAYYGSSSGLPLTPSWSKEIDIAGAHFGISVSTAGDVNGDGYSDILIGSSEYDPIEFIVVYILHGSSSGLTNFNNLLLDTPQSGFGISVSTAGDVNGDGYSDVIVGSDKFDNGQTDEGRVSVYYGSALGVDDSPNRSIESNQANSLFGHSVSSAGDVNGDGYSDVIVGAYKYDNGQSDEGRAFVYYGSASGLSASADWTKESNQGNAFYGYSVSSAGDVNADGFSDVIIGAYKYDNGQTDEGRAYVYHGSVSGLSASVNWTSESNLPLQTYASSVSAAGDVNGDGYSDVIIGNYGGSNGELFEGSTHFYYGSLSGLSLTANVNIESNIVNALFGYCVASAGDINGDGYSDVIVGSLTGSGDGSANAYYGNNGASLRTTVQQYKPGTSGVVSSGGSTGTIGQVRLNIFGKSPYGRTDGKITYEYKDNGIPFSGNVITNGTMSTGSGANTDLGATISGVQLNSDIAGLNFQKEYKWRARVQFSLVNNPYQKFGPWKYYNNYIPNPLGNFRPFDGYASRQLNITMLIQGFYNSSLNVMIRDTANIYLRQGSHPYGIVDSAKVYLSSTGAAAITFLNAANGTNYYIQLKHKNSIETWSNTTQIFSFNSLNYDFSNAANKAFGDNMTQVDASPLKFAIYSGDVNQDGIVDGTDGVLIDNDAANFNTGYLSTDLNGDEVIDGSDAVIADNNAANFVSAVVP